MIGLNDSEEEKQKTTTTRLSFVLLTSAVLVLSSIAAAQLFMSDNTNAAFAGPDRDPCTSTDTEITCIEAGGEHGGGQGSRSTCTIDPSTGQTCTIVGGFGGTSEGGCDQDDCEDPFTGGAGGMTICTFDSPTGEDGGCSSVAGGSGSKPVPDEGG